MRKNSLHLDKAQLEEVVAGLRHVDIGAGRPHHDLLVQRNIGEILLQQGQRLGNLLVAFFAVELDLDLLGKGVEHGVRVALALTRRGKEGAFSASSAS